MQPARHFECSDGGSRLHALVSSPRVPDNNDFKPAPARAQGEAVTSRYGCTMAQGGARRRPMRDKRGGADR